MKYFLSLIALFVALLSGCRVSDVRELTVNVPAMAGEADVQRIRKAVEPLVGVKKDQLAFDVAGKKVTVVYDSMQIANKNIEIAIAEAGYAANEIPAISTPVEK